MYHCIFIEVKTFLCSGCRRWELRLTTYHARKSAYTITKAKTMPHICHIYHIWDMWRKICHVEKFQISMHDRCGEIWNFSTCGVISNFSTWQMWRNLKFLHSWHVYDAENVLKCLHVMLFCWKIGFVVIYAVFCEICFDAIYALLCREKLNQRLHMWREKWQYEVWSPFLALIHLQHSAMQCIIQYNKITCKEI